MVHLFVCVFMSWSISVSSLGIFWPEELNKEQNEHLFLFFNNEAIVKAL